MDTVEQSLIVNEICDDFESVIRKGEDQVNAIEFFENHPKRQELGEFATQIRSEAISELILLELDFFSGKEQDSAHILEKYPDYVDLVQEKISVVLNQSLEPVACPQCNHPLIFEADSSEASCNQCGYSMGDSIIGTTVLDRKKRRNVISLNDLPERFDLRKKVGEGAFGVVYKAWDRKLERFVAVKTPKWKVVDRELFLREARAAGQLRHPHIVQVFDVGDVKDTSFIVSDFIDGTPLSKWRKNRDMSIDQVLEMGEKICSAVSHAHERGIIHRDLKPGNIVIDKNDDPHVLDFGLSKSLNWETEYPNSPGCPIGTPAYMSPEQVKGDLDEVDKRTDIYSLGVIYYQLLTDYLPFTGNSPNIFQNVLHQTPPSPRVINPSIPVALTAIVMKALRKKADDRYQSVDEMRSDLSAFVTGEPVKAYPRIESRVLKKTVKKRYKAALITILTLFCLTLTYWVWSLNQVIDPKSNAIIDSNPPGAHLTWIKYDPDTGHPDFESQRESIGGEPIRIEPGHYLIKAESSAGYMEVHRYVPRLKTEMPVKIIGIPVKHRNFHWKNGLAVLDPIDHTVAEKIPDAVFVKGGTLKIPKLIAGMAPNKRFPMSPMFSDINMQIQSFNISRGELTIETIKARFPNLDVNSVNYDVAMAYAESVGASLPSIYEILYLGENPAQDSLEGLLDGRSEWTSTPKLEIRLGELVEGVMPANFMERIVIGSTESFPAGMPAPKSVQHVLFVKVANAQFNAELNDEYGFRLVRRFKANEHVEGD